MCAKCVPNFNIEVPVSIVWNFKNGFGDFLGRFLWQWHFESQFLSRIQWTQHPSPIFGKWTMWFCSYERSVHNSPKLKISSMTTDSCDYFECWKLGNVLLFNYFHFREEGKLFYITNHDPSFNNFNYVLVIAC